MDPPLGEVIAATDIECLTGINGLVEHVFW